MTTEEDFQRQLDSDIEDHHTRLVFADWLEEHNDPRAEGYRALGVMQRVPVRLLRLGNAEFYWSYHNGMGSGYSNGRNIMGYHNPFPRQYALPQPWLDKLINNNQSAGYWAHECGTYWGSRREAEDAAARAFALLPRDHKESSMFGYAEEPT